MKPTLPDRHEDRKLAKSLRSGKQLAWEQFYSLYAAPLWRFVLTRLKGREDIAADITQDVIVIAIERIKHFDSKKGSLWKWLCGIAMNKVRESSRNLAQNIQVQKLK